MLKIAFALISLLAAAVFAGDKPTPPPSTAERYFIVNDADYRTVDPAAFARFAPSCVHVVRKRYPAERVDVHLCYV